VKVLHLIDHLSLGGAQRAVRDLLEQRPHDRAIALHLKTPESTTALPREALLYGGAKTAMGYLSLLPRIWLASRRGRFDIIHCHLPVSWLYGILLASVEFASRPALIFHERGGVLNLRGPYDRLLRAAARRGQIVCVSGYIRDRVAERGIDQGEMLVVHNAIDLTYFHPDPRSGKTFRRHIGLGPKETVIGFAGRLVPEKGWRVLVEAFRVLESRPRARLLIAGTGAEAGALQGILEAGGLEGRTTFLGYTEDMLGFYNALDMCVFPSLVEPFGRVQLEAQACGVPVIASRISGILETISSQNALLVAPGDPDQLMRAILRLEANPKLGETLRRAGLENVRRFGLSNYFTEMEALYARLAG
jgi:glycosyltransferase involved in cell wall biosynthesis